jgi:antitoxin HicB
MAQNINYYLSLSYTIELTNDDDFWFVEIPLLDGCMTNGESWEDALEMIDDAKRAWLTTALELGIAIPEPEFEK